MFFPPKAPMVLLENVSTPGNKGGALLFSKPKEVLSCTSFDQIQDTLKAIVNFQNKGFYLAGWISYEVGLAFHPTLKTGELTTSPEPLIWMGVFETPKVLSSKESGDQFSRFEKKAIKAKLKAGPKAQENEKDFNKAFQTIQDYIRAGDIYQVNHTFPLFFKTYGPAFSLYANLRKTQPVPYSAFIDTGEWQILSLSPELFMKRRGDKLTSRPMKGTAKPGVNLEETKKRMKALGGDEKNRAENLMITDLIRNDISRVCKAGTVKVPKLFEVERFKTVLQMSSEVTGTLKPGVGFLDIFIALFPCGSITGAPKVRAMEIIDETEPQPRGIYTGALGAIMPNGNFTFSVPIRTAVLNKKGQGRLSIGSGLVAQSKAEDEYDECLLKGKFLNKRPENFALIETMLWDPVKGFLFEKEHLRRLQSSAEFFGFQFREDKIKDGLEKLGKSLKGPSKKKVRLLMEKDGAFTFESHSFDPRVLTKPLKIEISPHRVSSGDPFLYHKTTKRALYNQELARAKALGLHDILFQNEQGLFTEGTINNLFVKGNRGQLLTPKLDSGLLPGILRQDLIQSGQFQEASLTCDVIENAEKIWVGNSVTGLVEVSMPKPLAPLPKT